MAERGRRSRLARWLTGALVLLVLPGVADAAVKARTVLIVPFDASALEPSERWIGEGVAQVVALGLTQHPAFVQVDRARLRAFGRPEVWGESVVVQAARGVHADAALYGRVTRAGAEWSIQPRLLETKAPTAEAVALEPIVVPDGELLARLAALPLAYARTLKMPLGDADARRLERAAQPTRSLRAFELFARAQEAVARGGQEGNEQGVDLLARAIETDPNFVVAQYSLGVVHQALGNRWKAAAQFRASTQLDATYPEPYKALGDLFLAAPRRLFEQAVEAYSRAIELRPFYAEAHVGLGDARAAKGDIDGAIAAYQKALVFNAVNPKVHMSLGKIYYTEKGLYYEAVTAYKRAIELDTHSVEARMGLGEVYEDKGLYKDAIEEYQRVIELDARHTGALYNLALVYERKGHPVQALKHARRYRELTGSSTGETR